jgi:hypothetical protein
MKHKPKKKVIPRISQRREVLLRQEMKNMRNQVAQCLLTSARQVSLEIELQRISSGLQYVGRSLQTVFTKVIQEQGGRGP